MNEEGTFGYWGLRLYWLPRAMGVLEGEFEKIALKEVELLMSWHTTPVCSEPLA